MGSRKHCQKVPVVFVCIIKMNVLFEILYKISKNLQCPDIIICNSSYLNCELQRRAHFFVSCAVIRPLTMSLQSLSFTLVTLLVMLLPPRSTTKSLSLQDRGPVFCSSPAASSDFMPGAQSFPG